MKRGVEPRFVFLAPVIASRGSTLKRLKTTRRIGRHGERKCRTQNH
jgi:hypothetical protein